MEKELREFIFKKWIYNMISSGYLKSALDAGEPRYLFF
jgi:hypothetical protein